MDGPYQSIDEIRRANRAAGQHWFEPGAMGFFATRIEGELHGGRYFVTSEEFVASDGSSGGRRYSVRFAGPDGAVHTVGDFQAHGTADEAHDYAGRLAVATAHAWRDDR